MDFVDIALYLTYGLTMLAVLAAIAFPVINSVGDPASLKKGGLGVAALVVLFLLSWAISGSEVTSTFMSFGVGSGLSKFIGGILTMMYLMIFIAIGGIAFTEGQKFLKK